MCHRLRFLVHMGFVQEITLLSNGKQPYISQQCWQVEWKRVEISCFPECTGHAYGASDQTGLVTVSLKQKRRSSMHWSQSCGKLCLSYITYM